MTEYKCPHCQCKMYQNPFNDWQCVNCQASVSGLAMAQSNGRILEEIAKTLRLRNPWPPRWVGWV